MGQRRADILVRSNDLGVGRIVEAATRSKFWNQMAIFVIEDDAQNDPDHVDAHRTAGFVISPFCKRGVVDRLTHRPKRARGTTRYDARQAVSNSASIGRCLERRLTCRMENPRTRPRLSTRSMTASFLVSRIKPGLSEKRTSRKSASASNQILTF